MEIQLQELIDQIKKDGVNTAEAEAQKIIENAKAEAEKIIADAESKARDIAAKSKADNERLIKVSEDSIRQAGRNLLISFRESVNRELKAVVSEKLSEAYTPESLTKIILSVIEAWTKNTDAGDISVLLNSDDLKSLEEGLLKSLKQRLISGVTLKANDDFMGGFRISEADGSVYYDYSAESVVEMLSTYLNPRVTALMKEASL